MLDPAGRVPISAIWAIGAAYADPQVNPAEVAAIAREIPRVRAVSTFWVPAESIDYHPWGCDEPCLWQVACSLESLFHGGNSLGEA